MREVFSWKFVFYQVILPALRCLGPARSDRALGWLGRIAARLMPGRTRSMAEALRRGNELLETTWPVSTLLPAFAADTARFQARDYILDGLDDVQALARFDVRGAGRLIQTLQSGRGVILVGCHLGAHISGIHWFFRRHLPIRLLAQRPKHISGSLDRYFDSGGRFPQSELFLHRGMKPADAAQHILLARDAIRDGMAIYVNGDIPWDGPNTRGGRILGRNHQLLTTWIDLGLLTGSPIFWVFCTHEAGGRFALDIEPMETIRPGEEQLALDRYLAELNARIANDPTEAVAHLLWPCYSSSLVAGCKNKLPRLDRPSRRKPVARSS